LDGHAVFQMLKRAGGGGVAIVALVAVVLAGGLAYLFLASEDMGADPTDRAQVARGEVVYAQHCARCHGARLEGQPNWRERLANGRLPSPPHDSSGHTWHHADGQLFELTKHGVAPFAPEGYESDMPAYDGTLVDREIWDVLAFIKSAWPPEIRARQARLNQ